MASIPLYARFGWNWISAAPLKVSLFYFMETAQEILDNLYIITVQL